MCEDKLNIDVQLALEERKLIQSIINQQEDASFKIRGWAIALFTGITFIYFKQVDNELSDIAYFMVILALSFLFYWIEKRHMEAFFKLVVRASDVENILKTKCFEFKLQQCLRGDIKNKDNSDVGTKRFREIRLVYMVLPIIAIAVSGAWQTILTYLCL